VFAVARSILAVLARMIIGLFSTMISLAGLVVIFSVLFVLVSQIVK
jgi:hypothetical protein